jgi:hypothetical protein
VAPERFWNFKFHLHDHGGEVSLHYDFMAQGEKP